MASTRVKIVASNSSQQRHVSSHALHTAPQRRSPQHQEAQDSLQRSALLRAAVLAAGASLSGPLLAAAPATAAPSLAVPEEVTQVRLRTLSDCALAVSVYPTFAYNAAGGGGTGSVERRPDGLLHVTFDAAALRVPAVEGATTRVLGLPLPPTLRIEIVPSQLEGTVDPESGRAELTFVAEFRFTAGGVYAAPPLLVSTALTTEASDGVLRHGVGRRLDSDGRARLVGVARVPVTGDAFLDSFLALPTDALAELSAELSFS